MERPAEPEAELESRFEEPVVEVAEPEPEIGTGFDAPAEEAEAVDDDWVVETEDQTAGLMGSDTPAFEAPAPETNLETSFFGGGAAVEEEALPTFEEPEPEPEPEAPVAEAEPAGPVNPFAFGQRDPLDKARRLARVLVSDMIMYNPERHERALANDTLKEDFEDEIEKSWKEYVEQVGEEVAGGSDFWKEALNDVLAKGESIF